MNTIIAEAVYQTLTDTLTEPYQVPGVENAFAPNTPCAKLYEQIYHANLRLCERLGQTESDPDVELMINSFLEINHHIGLKMFHYGQALLPDTTARQIEI